MTSREITIAVYCAVIVAGTVVEVLARTGRTRLCTLSGCVTHQVVRRSTQLGLIVAWWWLGWHFLTGE